MSQKSVVITGISGGMAQATAKVFKAEGFHIVGVDINGDENIIVDDFFLGSVTDEKLWDRLKEHIDNKFGYLDVLINIAGRNYHQDITKSSLDEWRSMFEVNVLGMVASIKYLVPLLKNAPNPAIVNMSSISAEIGSIGYAAYCATKGAIDSLTKSLALELAPQIRVNAIAPGWIETEFTMDGLRLSADPIAYRSDVENMHALKRVGSPKEIAKAIYWMASNEASFMTGSVVVVDGGYMIKN